MTPNTYAPRLPTEDEEQAALFRWVAFQKGKFPELETLYHIPNEGKRSKSQGAKLKTIGLRPGVPDLCLPVARGGFHALYIEMKRTKNGRLSDDQRRWLEKLNAAGNKAVRCGGWENAAEVILNYLKG